tara:strand:+ start:2596 stop:2925 length:330 start_codon:yes stop_codon:yes gene_type:complete
MDTSERKKLEVPKAVKKEFDQLPDKVKKRFAASIDAIRKGLDPYLALSPLTKSVGKGVYELKINGKPAYRCVYIAKKEDAIHLLHFFTKTTNGVDTKAMKTAQKRLKDI